MPRSVLLALVLPLAAVTGCAVAPPIYEVTPYPAMTLSQASLEFGGVAWGESVERTLVLSNEGGMPMGVASINVGDASTSYKLVYTLGSIECPEVVADTAAAAKADTGGGGGTGGDDTGGGGGTGGDDTGTPTVVGSDALFVLDPGCQIALNVLFAPDVVGEVWDALVIESIGTELTEEEEAAGEDLPAYLADPIRGKQVVYLHGEATHSAGSVVVRPRSYNFGFVHPDGAADLAPARIQISNVGDGDATILSVALSDTCDAAFSLATSAGGAAQIPANTVVAEAQSTLQEIVFTPTDTNAAYCQLYILTDDVANAEVDVTLTANTGTDPENVPPTVFVRSPDPGYRYSTIRPLEIELNIFDANQPATSLVCRVKSTVQDATVADCTASDASGHVFVEVAADDLVSGVDTLVITVTDGSETTAYASVPIVVNASYPEDDDDGDGYGVATDPADCDDDNLSTYPAAAEIYDLADNDCDGVIDENTIGYDDDGDDYTEVDGDCNDYTDDSYPGAPERGDGMDNDCDGRADEQTSLYDDDGDGYAEVNNDCNDNDGTVNPSASETCDSVDNDCDGLRDDGCVSTDSSPAVVGDVIRMEQSACEEGEVMTLSVLVHDADGQTPSFSWTTDGDGTFDNAAAPTVNYTSPEIADGLTGKNENIYVVVLDPDGHQDWAFEKLAVYATDAELYEPYTRVIIQEAEGCSSTGGSPSSLVWLAGASLALAFRRRE